MTEKKNPGRFTIQFNAQDPQQQMVADYLERQGRHKAQFLTSTVLHYIHCPETPDIPQPNFPSQAELEELVLSILRRHGKMPAEKTSINDRTVIIESSDEYKPANPENDKAETLGDAELSAILKTLSDFNRT